MINKKKLFALIAFFLVSFFTEARTQGIYGKDPNTNKSISYIQESIQLEITLITLNVEGIKKKLSKLSKELGGYIKSLDKSFIKLKIPSGAFDDKIIKKISSQGLIINKKFQRINYQEKIMDLETSIKAKEKHLHRLYGLFHKTNFRQTLNLEKAIHRVVLALEEKKGKLNLYKDMLRFAVVIVHFDYNVPMYRHSGIDIDWINSLGITNFIKRFHR